MPFFSRQQVTLVLITFLATAIGTACLIYRPQTIPIAISWGDGKYGQAFYGAEVSTRPEGDKFAVHARVRIGTATDLIYQHDCGRLGTVATHAEAVQQFGTIRWTAEGLYIGQGKPTDYFLPRERIESHR